MKETICKNKKLFVGVVVALVLVCNGTALAVHKHADNDEAVTEQTTSNETKQNNTEVAKRQKNIKENLTNYLKTVTNDGTVSVSFYNLGATSGSVADKSKYAAVYQKGELEVESNANTAQTAASTYKLFITAYLMKQKLNGNFTWNASNEDGFYRMIVNSENDYADALVSTYGMNELNDFIAKQGWYSPVFQHVIIAQTTSYSLQLLLQDLAEGTGSFTNTSDRNKILKLMGKQVYRDGIPAGVAAADKGTTVTDKVGFLDDTNNDAAIVTMPNGQKYILVIMTHGYSKTGASGFSKIAKIAKKVQQIVYGDNAGVKVEKYTE